MRSEYVDAVNAVRWGWSLWTSLLVPALLIWTFALRRRRSFGRGLVRFLIACVSFYALGVMHSNRIQAAKETYMETDAERQDWGTDTWNVFAPVSMAPYAIVYCGLHAGLALGVAGLRNRYWSRPSLASSEARSR